MAVAQIAVVGGQINFDFPDLDGLHTQLTVYFGDSSNTFGDGFIYVPTGALHDWGSSSWIEYGQTGLLIKPSLRTPSEEPGEPGEPEEPSEPEEPETPGVPNADQIIGVVTLPEALGTHSVSDYTVSVYQMNGSITEFVKTTTVAEDLTFSISGLDQGGWFSVHFDDASDVLGSGWYNSSSSLTNWSSSPWIGAGTSLELSTKLAGSITGDVLLPEDATVNSSDLRVVAIDDLDYFNGSSGLETTAAVNSDLSFTIPGLDPNGKYRVRLIDQSSTVGQGYWVGNDVVLAPSFSSSTTVAVAAQQHLTLLTAEGEPGEPGEPTTTGSVSGQVVFPNLCPYYSQWSGLILWKVVGGVPVQAGNLSNMSVDGAMEFSFTGLAAGSYRATVHVGNPDGQGSQVPWPWAPYAAFLGQVYGGASLPLHSYEMTAQQILAGTALQVTDGALPAISIEMAHNPAATNPQNCGGPSNVAPVIGQEMPSISVEEGQSGTVALSASDADGDDLTWSVSGPAEHGVATVPGGVGTSKTVTYTPDAGYVGTDYFVVSVSDGKGGLASVQVDVEITEGEPPTATGSVSGQVVFSNLCPNYSQWSGVILWKVVGGQPVQAGNWSNMSLNGVTEFSFTGLAAGSYRVTVHVGNPDGQGSQVPWPWAPYAAFLGQVYGGASLPLHSYEMTAQQILAGTALTVVDGALPAISVPMTRNPNASSPAAVCGDPEDGDDELPAGAVSSWGNNSNGQVANTPAGTDFVQIAGGIGHTVALKSDGSVAAWGRDDYKQVTNKPSGTGFVQIDAEGLLGLARKADGSLKVWGGIAADKVATDAPTGTGFKDASLGHNHAVALKADGSIFSWGKSNTAPAIKNTPTGTGFFAVAAGASHHIALAGGGLKVTPATVEVTGTAKVGSTLTAKVGTWKPTPSEFVYQWRRGTTDIPDATGATYVPVAADVDQVLSVRVTGSRAGHDDAVAVSKATKKVAKGSLTTVTPKITGTAKVGSTLTASADVWGPAPVTLSHQCYRSGKTITGATGTTYVLTGADKGKTITVKVTGAKDGYSNASTTSKKTKKVAAGTLTDVVVPTVTGPGVEPLKVGDVLTVSQEVWGPEPVTMKYQWYRSGKKISKATGTAYTLTASDEKKQITVKVTGSKTGYTSVTKTSAKTAKIVKADLTPVIPTITGDAVVGQTLTAVPGSWGPTGVSFSYQWYRGTTAIKKATKPTYNLVAADAGQEITVKVTGSKSGYNKAATQTSEPTAVAP